MPKTKIKKNLPSPKAPPRVEDILAALDQEYPEAKCTLSFTNPLELLVATILSAQCTDQRVNIVTKTLFKKYTRAEDYAGAALEQVEEDIRSTGFFHNKAKAIKGLAEVLVNHYQGQVPGTLEALVGLPGVGRKTANVVLGNAFGVPGITVDTHVGRVAQRLGLTDHQDPVKIEYDLMANIPKAHWTKFSHQVIIHGRQVCNARKPDCDHCFLYPYCRYGQTRGD